MKRLDEILSEYILHLKRVGKRYDVAEWLSQKLLAFFGNVIVPLSDAQMEEWGAHAQREYVRRGIFHLRTVHAKAGLRRPKVPEFEYEPGTRRQLSLEDARNTLSQMPWGSPERALVEIMLLTGARLRHVLNLKVKDDKGDRLVTRSRKGRGLNKLRMEEHPVTADLRRVLSSVVASNADPESYIIQIDGHQADYGSFSKRFMAAQRRAGVKNPIPRFAWFRNFSATQLIEGDIPLEVTSRILGHESQETTKKHYDKAKLIGQRAKAAEFMADLMLPKDDALAPTENGGQENTKAVSESNRFEQPENEDTLPVV